MEWRRSKVGTNRPGGGHLEPKRGGPEFRCTGDRYPVTVRKLLPAGVFVAIFAAHALYVGYGALSASSGWTDDGLIRNAAGYLGLGAYWRGQDYFIGFSYGLGAAFATWALSHCILPSRKREEHRGGSGCWQFKHSLAYSWQAPVFWLVAVAHRC